MVAKAIYIVCILLLKLSILFQFLRVFVPRRLGNLVMFWGTTGLIAANVIFYIIEFFLAIIQCKPRVRGWNRSVPGTCIGSSNIVYTAAFNVISDFLILLLPLHRIWRLQMPTRRKIGISLTFATGIVYGNPSRGRFTQLIDPTVLASLVLCDSTTASTFFRPRICHITTSSSDSGCKHAISHLAYLLSCEHR